MTTATDIYSLGAVLYELVTGQRAHKFASGSITDLEKTVCETVPEKPSIAASQNPDLPLPARRQRKHELSGDLDKIIMTALHKDPQRRYASAAQFSDDIRRHLEGRTVTARDDRWTYRTGKFIRRNKLGVAAACLVVTSLVGGIITTTFQARRAERRFQIARGLANSVLFDLHDQVQQLPGSTKARAAMIETVLRFLDNLAIDADRDAGLKLEIAKAYHRVAAIEGHPFHANLGLVSQARAHFLKSLEMLRPLQNVAETHAAAIDEIARVNIEIGDVDAAIGDYEAAKTRFKTSALLVDMSEVTPDTYVYAFFRLGDIEAQQGTSEAAVPHFRKALERAQSWAASSNEPEALRTLRASHQRLANASREAGDLIASRDNLLQAKRLVESRLSRPDTTIEDRRNMMLANALLADIYGGPDDLNLGDYPAAVKYYRAAAKLAENMSLQTNTTFDHCGIWRYTIEDWDKS